MRLHIGFQDAPRMRGLYFNGHWLHDLSRTRWFKVTVHRCRILKPRGVEIVR